MDDRKRLNDWVAADREFRRAVGLRCRAEVAELEAMLVAMRSGAAEQLGFATFYDYASDVLGMKERDVYERVRMAEALERLPRLHEALATQKLCFSAVRELCRVCVAETETAWIDAAAGCSVREVEQLVSGHQAGDLPGGPIDLSAVRRTLVFEVSAATQVLFKELRRRMEAELGHRIDDDTLISELSRAALAADSRKPGTPSYQIAVTLCPSCEGATQDGAGQVVAIDTPATEQAMCDAQWLDLTHDLGEPSTHVGEEPHVGKTTRSVSPTTRRAVMARDHHRCRVPGCRSSRYIEVHHLKFRSRGGLHTVPNLILLCGAHHRAVHEARLVIEGNTSTTATFHHPDGSDFGARGHMQMQTHEHEHIGSDQTSDRVGEAAISQQGAKH